MIVAWALLNVMGVFTARYGKAMLGVWWFRIHLSVQLSVLVLTVTSFGLIVNDVRIHKPHARQPHVTRILTPTYAKTHKSTHNCNH